MELSHLLKKIENTRHDLIEAAADCGYASNKTIEISRQLDDLLNQYEKIKGCEK